MGSQKKRPVTLTAADREELVRVTTTGVHPASMIRRARVLLALDTSTGEVDPKEVIAARLGVSGETLRLVARRFAETGGDIRATIGRKQRDASAGAVAGDRGGRGPVDRVGVLSPAGRTCAVDAAAAGEARRLGRGHPRPGPLHHRPGAKKTELRPHLKKCWTIPPKANAEFVARMEDVLAVYARPHDPARAGGVHGRETLPAPRARPRPDPRRTGQRRQEDCEYVRHGTCSIFVLGRAAGRLAPGDRPAAPYPDRLGPRGRAAC